MKSVVVVGTNHDIQRGEYLKDDFTSYLIDLCINKKIKVIAEEINDDAKIVIARDVCHQLNIVHKIIEPNPREYASLGVKEYHRIEYEIMSKYNLDQKPSIDNGTPAEALIEFESRKRNEHCSPREIEWLKRMQDYDSWPALVICGSEHFEPFCSLLSDNQINVITMKSNWGI